MGTTPSRHGRLSREDGVEAVQSHEDAIASTRSSSSSFLTLSQYLADDNLGIHEETLDLRRHGVTRRRSHDHEDAVFPKFKLRNSR